MLGTDGDGGGQRSQGGRREVSVSVGELLSEETTATNLDLTRKFKLTKHDTSLSAFSDLSHIYNHGFAGQYTPTSSPTSC